MGGFVTRLQAALQSGENMVISITFWNEEKACCILLRRLKYFAALFA